MRAAAEGLPARGALERLGCASVLEQLEGGRRAGVEATPAALPWGAAAAGAAAWASRAPGCVPQRCDSPGAGAGRGPSSPRQDAIGCHRAVATHLWPRMPGRDDPT